jgi:hypothetical protein
MQHDENHDDGGGAASYREVVREPLFTTAGVVSYYVLPLPSGWYADMGSALRLRQMPSLRFI